MELRNLTTFVRIAEVQNFSRAAQQLGYSQSAVTMQIQQLERELQTQLFERIGRQTKLTQAGERLLPYALEIVTAAGRAERAVREPEQITGSLRIGTCESHVISLLPPVFRAFADACPQVELRVQTALVPDLFRALRQNNVDVLCFLDKKAFAPEWVRVFERPERVHFIASSVSPLAGQTRIPLETLLAQPLILTERGISYRYAMEQALAEQGFELHPVLEIGNTAVITQFLLAGRGISFLPDYVVQSEVDAGQLAILDTQCPEITMWSQVVYHRNKHITPQMQIFLDLLQTRLAHGQPMSAQSASSSTSSAMFESVKQTK